MLINRGYCKRVQKLLREDRMSQSAIAKSVGVSRHTVDRINQRMVLGVGVVEDISNFEDMDEKVRCPKCGGLHFGSECRVCEVREKIASGEVSQCSYLVDDVLEFDLLPEDKEAYKECRAKLEASGQVGDLITNEDRVGIPLTFGLSSTRSASEATFSVAPLD